MSKALRSKRVTFSETNHYFPSETDEEDRKQEESSNVVVETSAQVVAVEADPLEGSAEAVLTDNVDGITLAVAVQPPVEQPTTSALDDHQPRYLSRLSEEEYKNAFYTPYEVQQMRIDACDKAAQYNRSVRLYLDPEKLTKAKSEGRGLENSSYERDQHRSICIEAVVEGQKHVKKLNDGCSKPKDKLKEDDYLARLSSNCSKWARDVAREDGNFDYEEAYGDEPWFPKKRATPTPVEATSKRGNRTKTPSHEHLPPVFALEHRPFPYYNYFDAILDATKIPTPKKTSFWSKLCRRKHQSSQV